jgi:hypothetical protein
MVDSNNQAQQSRLGRYVQTVAFDEKLNAYVPPKVDP